MRSWRGLVEVRGQLGDGGWEDVVTLVAGVGLGHSLAQPAVVGAGPEPRLLASK